MAGVPGRPAPRPTHPQSLSRVRAWASVLVLMIATTAAYRETVGLGFVWDDGLITSSGIVSGTRAGITDALTSDLYNGRSSGNVASAYWRPAAMLSLAANRLFGRGPGPLHAGNVLLHLLVAALLVVVLERRLRDVSRAIPVAVALLWALHPEHVEVVAWLSCRYDLLTAAAVLLLLAIPFRPGARPAMLHGAVFLMGLLSKEGFPAMAAVILADDWSNRRSLREALPRWTAIGIALALWAGARSVLSIHSLSIFPAAAWEQLPREYLSTVATYAWRAVAPLPLTIGHSAAPASAPVLAVSAALILGFAALAVRVRRLAVPIVLFLGPLVGTAVASASLGIAAERYFYVPSLGLAWLLAEAVAAVARRSSRVALIAAASIVAVAAWSAWCVAQRVPDWKSDETLFGAALTVDPDDWQANFRLGTHAATAGRLVEAAQMLERAAARNPRSGQIASGLAWVHLLEGATSKALSEATRAVALEPRSPQARLHLAAALHLDGQHGRELAELDAGFALAPDYEPLRLAHASARCEPDPVPGCEAELESLSRLTGTVAVDAAAELGAVSLRRGDRAAAARWLARLQSLEPRDLRVEELEHRIGAMTAP